MKEKNKKIEKKRLLIYAHYYVPDTASTGQIVSELAEGLLDNFDITVICVVPSYLGTIEQKYKQQKYYNEDINGVRILRVRVPEFDKANKISRVKNIISYFSRAMFAIFKVGKQDYVFSISQPPILGGLLGVWGKFIKKAKFIYNIQDFNPEQILAVGYSKQKILVDLLMTLDKFSCRQSDMIITVGRDLMETLQKRFCKEKLPHTVMINNWIDEKEIYPLNENDSNVEAFKKKYNLENKFVIMYSGNIGLYYDLKNIIKVLKKFRKGYNENGVYEEGPKMSDGREVAFAFVGAGPVLEDLIEYSNKHHFENIYFIPYQEKSKLKYSLNAGDVHFCVNSKGIKGVSCPSKAYGIMAAGKPILGILEKETEIRGLIEKSECGICCEPGEYSDIFENIQRFIDMNPAELKKMGENGRNYLEQHLTKEISIRRYEEEILKL